MLLLFLMFNLILGVNKYVHYVKTNFFLYRTYFCVFVKKERKNYNKLNDNYKLISE